MSCNVSPEKLAAFFDGELARADQAGLASHIASCKDCSENLRQMQSLRGALRSAAPSVPASLASRVEMALADEEEVPSVPPSRFSFAHYGALAASYIAVALIGGGLGSFWLSQRDMQTDITHDVVAAHARAMMQDQPFQVASSDQHTVKPWFAGRIEFSPQVKDFAAQGYALAGGRLDYIGQNRVAALVYRHDKHVIDLFIWPTSQPDSAPQFSDANGFHIASWNTGGMQARAVSDMGGDEMKAFAALAAAP